jgi:hypothetical protein
VRWTIAAVFALAAPLASTASAGTSTTVTTTSGRQVLGSFTFDDTVTCDAGTFIVPTFVSILSFDNTIKSHGQTTTTLTTDLFLGSFSECGQRFEFKEFNGVGALSMTAVDSASLSGHFVFDDGTYMDLNLTFAGTDSTTQGHTMNRTIFPRFMTLTRNNGSSRSASTAGSINSNGNVVGASTFTDPEATLSRNTSGQITVMRF